jgi:crotonobetaine/carnitine-CoA ligase
MSAEDILVAFPPSERILPAILQRQAKRYGSHPVVVTHNGSISFEQAPALAARFAGTLAVAGIRRGDRVALMCSNRAEFIECYCGCAWLGAIVVPINIAARGPQLQHILTNSGARLLIIEAELLNAVDHINLSALALERIWCIGDQARTSFDGLAVSTLPPRAQAIEPGGTDPAQLLAILYTSGTTGPSKGVCCPQAQYFWWALNGIRNLEIREADVLCTSLPLFHSNALGTFYKAVLSGSTIVVEPRFSASRFWQSLVQHRATATYVLGAMVPILLAREPTTEERSHRVRCGLGPGVPANLHIAFEQRSGIRLIDGYGSTETNFVIGSTTAERRPGSMGKICPGYHARVIDRNGDDAPPGDPGELILRSDDPLSFATGYFAMPQETAAAFRNGWFHTGDRVVREADGSYRFLDRLKDAIRRRGENISSYEVEQVLLSNPAVAAAAVFAVPSELAEEEVMAAIVRRPGSVLTEGALHEFCKPRLARFALPRFIEFVDALPMTENGKVQKFRLRDRGVGPKTWDHDAVAEPKQPAPIEHDRA